MKITSKGATKSSLDEYMTFWTEKLQEVYGNDFSIRKEGLIDNFATASSLACMRLEDVLMYYISQRNPYTTEDEFQDQMYAEIGLERQFASYTKATRTLQGTAGTVCDVGSVRFKSIATEDIFVLNTAVTIGDNGTAVGSFTAIELGGVELEPSAKLEIIDAPDGITGVYYSQGNMTTVGDDYEDNSEYRERWLATNSASASSNTQGGLKTSLLPLVNNNSTDLVIRQNRNRYVYDDLPLHTMNIVIRSGESDTTIAQAILDNLTDGVGLEGKTSVTLKDQAGTDTEILFTRATEVPIYFKIEVKLKENFFIAQVERTVQDIIVENLNYAMGEKVVANDFYQYVNEVDGIDYVNVLQISPDNETWGNIINMDYNEYGSVTANHINVSEVQ